MNTRHELSDDVVQALRENRKIEAIKCLRAETGIGLKEAKHAIEAYARAHPQPTPVKRLQSDSGAGRIVLIVVVLLMVYAAWQWLF